MAPRAEFSTEQVRGKARKDLLYLLEGVRGKKNLVFDRSLVGPIGTIVKVATLQEYGVDKFFILENNNVDASQRNVVFVARGECGRHAEAIAAQIKRIQRESQTTHDFHIFWVPRRTLVSDQLLEEAGVLGDINISELPLLFFPLEDDVLSLELEDSFKDLYLSKDITPNFLMAKALMEVQQNHGLFPRIIGKGDNAKRVADLLVRMRQERLAGEDGSDVKTALTPSTTNESVIIIDREVDFVTPLLTQLTYEGLIDEIFEIQNNQAKVDTTIVGAPAQSSTATSQSRKRTVQLDSSDKLYEQLRNANFAIVGGLLNKVARRLQKVQSDYESKHKTKTIAELKEFVSQLPGYQQEHQSARIHTGLAEEIIKHTRTDLFKGLLEVQQNLAAGADPSSQFDGIEELIAREAPLRETLRLLCIYSCISGGIKPKDLEQFKRLILQGYGYQHLLTLNNLEKLQLFLSRSSPLAGMIPMTASSGADGTKTNYTYLRKQLRLIVDEVQEDDPNDIAYVYSGYAPLSIRLVQCILQKQYLLSITKGNGAANASGIAPGAGTQGWHGFDEAVKHVRGQTFYELQKGEDKAVKARALLSGSGQKQTVFVVFVGGVTFTEIAALRFIAKQEESRRKIVICATSIISGNRMMDAAIEKEAFARKEPAPVASAPLDTLLSQRTPWLTNPTKTGGGSHGRYLHHMMRLPSVMLLEKEVPIGPSFSPTQDTDSFSSISSLAAESVAKSQSQVPASPSSFVSSRQVSGRGSSDESSEVAQEIVVWTEDMELSSGLSNHDTEESSGMHLDTDDEKLQHGDDAPLPADPPEDAIAESFTSSHSSLSDLSDVLSSPSIVSSKATTPVETEIPSRPQIGGVTQTFSASSSYRHDIERLTFNVRPKSSIPTDIPSYQYASECIAAAESSRLNPYALHPEEYHFLRHHISHSQVTTYLNIRNGILRIWMKQPSVGVTRQEAVGCANARWFDAASVCYDWLVRRGYINYGCVQLPEPQADFKNEPPTKKRKTIAIIGAGISGLSCARQLDGLFKQHAGHFYSRGEEPPKVVILEGRGRVGGRVYSREFKTRPATVDPEFRGKRHTAEMGGMIITGFDRGNPLNVIVRGQLGIPYHALTADTTIYDSNGKPVDPVRDLLVEKLYNDCLDRVSEFKYKYQPSKVIEGNRDLLDEGRDSLGDGSKTIIQAEEATAALPDAPSVSQQNVPETVNMVPVSSDKLTGRVHNEPGVPGTIKASEKAKLMGWNVKAGAADKGNLDLTQATTLEGSTLGSVLDYTITQYKNIVDLNAQDHRLINWHIANLEYSNATNLHNLSLGLWDIDAGNEWEGPHTMVVGGYQSVARGLLQCPSPLEVKTKFAVQRITYHGEGFDGPASIESEDGTVVEADAVVCTIPLGVLKQGTIQFEPPLPSEKADAVLRLGFGILNKVVLLYDRVFWDSDRHIFGVLRDAPNRHSTSQQDYSTNRGRFFQWFNVTNTTGLPCLIALMAGDAGFDTEHTSNDSLVAEATDILRSVFGKDVPYPIETVVTRWGSDRFARGSYSSAAPDMQPDDYNVMAQPAGNLFFAGEHTIGTHPATVHGAYLSGLRAASEVLESMIGPIEVPTPLVLPRDSLLLHKRKEAAKDPRQARLEAYEIEVWEHVLSKIGERPLRPNKVAGSAYILFSKAHFEAAKKRCEESRKPGRSRSIPNEVRIMTSRMWKEATPEQKKPYEEQVAEQKKRYLEAMQEYNALAEKWDRQAMALRAAYEEEHPSLPGPEEGPEDDASTAAQKRRAKNVSYVEGGDTDVDT
ncbi:Sec1-like protein [Trichoderma citrinoviride]|uniref:Sec1-like protein n=1 Tax=Trichoderma citrinoviride TaxID=58853 RepID=A0A2T4B7N4_9HYPO|nr:Sec1-like protein [Trichoderma citrinoviride]PTB65335.1 Sec1-like protein [Trichoderma citrinoviride]